MSNVYDSIPLHFGYSTKIRVIEILDISTSDAEDLIACQFHTMSLDFPSYVALSHTWGPPERPRPLCSTAKHSRYDEAYKTMVVAVVAVVKQAQMWVFYLSEPTSIALALRQDSKMSSTFRDNLAMKVSTRLFAP